jgi:hypothetical protein
VGPVAPVGPVGPVGPGTVLLAPVAPVAPVGPVGPCVPVAPGTGILINPFCKTLTADDVVKTVTMFVSALTSITGVMFVIVKLKDILSSYDCCIVVF